MTGDVPRVGGKSGSQDTLGIFFFTFIYLFCVYGQAHVEVKGQPAGLSSLLPSCEFQAIELRPSVLVTFTGRTISLAPRLGLLYCVLYALGIRLTCCVVLHGCVPHSCLVPAEARGRCWIYRWL